MLILTNSVGGLHNFRKEVVKAIVDAGNEVIISIPELDSRADYFTNIGCKIVLTSFKRRGMNPWSDFKLMLAYLQLIKGFKPKVVLTYTIKPNIYGGMACRITDTPQIANITGLGDAVENPGLLQKLTIALYKIGLFKTNKIFFQNAVNRSNCQKLGISKENSILLPGSGVNLEHHIYQNYPQNTKIKFLFIGRLLRDKGIEEYLTTAKVIKSKYPNTEFQILGNMESDYQDIIKELSDHGVITYLGTTTDVRPYIGNVHCTILPSYHEGMSNVNLESSANGRPVITTDVPGCRETVEDTKTGFVIPPRNSNALIEAVERFINLPYEQKIAFGKAAREKVEREFDRQIVVKAYLKAINSLQDEII